MSNCRKFSLISLISCTFLFPLACKNKKPSPGKDMVVHVATIQERVSEELQRLVESLQKNNGRLNDSVNLAYSNLADSIYQKNNYQTIWSTGDHWQPYGDSLFSFIDSSKYYGLFPEDYHDHSLSFIHRVFLADSLGKKNAALWARADVLLTDAFFTLVKHIKQGRLKYDSVTLRTDTVLHKEIFLQALSDVKQTGSVAAVLEKLEPKYPGYDSLRKYLREFLAKADFKPYTYLVYPYKDSIAFFHLFEKRLHEIGIIQPNAANLDTLAFQRAVRKYQRMKNYRATGYLSDPLVDLLNDSDWERFKRVAVNLDRYKLLPDTLPRTYVWANLPNFMLRVIDDDTLVFQSRIIVGQPQTRTPLLNSEISNFITYPQWTVPYSIIFKEMLPKIKEDVEFLNKENLMVVDANDSVLDPHNINWEKLSRNHFPYLIKQKQGDDNSLGVIKFNFRNKYSVYMHDTNVRWMFGKSFRALSHGCVRVKEWKKMANFLIRNDTLKYHSDTLRAWIARQEKHVVSGFTKVPVFIRYFSCEGKDGRIKFYDDIYEEDRYLTEKYFGDKTVE